MWTYSNLHSRIYRGEMSEGEIECLFNRLYDQKKFCFWCGINLGRDEVNLYEICRFCPYCGVKNDYFDENIFFEYYGRVFDEVQKFECELGHSRFKKSYKKNLLLEILGIEDAQPFCCLCGKLLVLLN